MSKTDCVIRADHRDSRPSWPSEPMPHSGAPNIVMLVLDDVGFAQLGCYGSDIRTPNIDALAANGLRLSNFHTTGMCSATRSCLLTGRNHHSNHMGAVAEVSTGFPGYDFRMPKENGTLAEILVECGYATLAVGKWHLTPADEYTMGSTRKRWPLGRGFERFYGFHGGDTSQYYPHLVCDNHQSPPPRTPEQGYHLSEDLTDKSIELIRDVHNSAPGKPFFLYFALGAMHTPLHVPREFPDRYRGRFDSGWDAWRRRVHDRQIAEGILPPGTELTPRPEWIPAWESLTATEKRVSARLMEVFAGFLEHTDIQIGRLVDELRHQGKLDNTVFLILSDNWASSEGGRNGMLNNIRYVNGIRESADEIAPALELIGGLASNPHYPYGWAWAGNCPFRRWKQEVHAGGVQDPLIVHWPKGIRDKGGVRHQYAHAIDVMPTLLTLAGIEAPEMIGGIRQAPIHGVSFAPMLTDGTVQSGHITQYFEMRGCRGLYHDGWKIVTYRPRVGLAWDGSDPLRPLCDDPWELYHVARDFSEMHDLASERPDLVARLKEMWWVEAGRYDVLPIDNRGVARLGDRKAPAYAPGERHVLYPSAGTIGEYASIDTKNRTHSISADLVVGNDSRDGVIVSFGTGYGGYALFVHDGFACYTYNYASIAEYEVRALSPLPVGRVSLTFEFERTGEHQGQGRLLVNGRAVGEAAIPHTVPISYNNAEMAIGFNPGYGVSHRYRAQGRFEFQGTIERVTIHRENTQSTSPAMLDPIAMAIQ